MLALQKKTAFQEIKILVFAILVKGIIIWMWEIIENVNQTKMQVMILNIVKKLMKTVFAKNVFMNIN